MNPARMSDRDERRDPNITDERCAPAPGDAAPLAPELIGPYRILQRLGAGGMGEVFLAEQIEPVRRRVALKLIKLGMDTRETLARFEAERQALALMNHPNIAGVLDAGATPGGRPYFVMEYVPGEPITTYCDRHRLSLNERLELFIQVCNGVQHAHQKAVIHRDLKPTNILIMLQDGVGIGIGVVSGTTGPRPVPKIIDFGVAKAINQRLTEHTLFTEHGLLIGTPEYMSPEQAEMNMLDIDTRTDIYALGVLLYELLTGTLPFERGTLRRAAMSDIQRIIREVEPPKPSTRLSSLETLQRRQSASGAHASDPDMPTRTVGLSTTEAAIQRAREAAEAARKAAGGEAATAAEIGARRRMETRALVKTLRGDLDWIVMRCLEKDRTRRYDTAGALAMEIRRYLNHEPVLAGPPGVGYRARKFVMRHRGGVVAGGVIAAALLVAVGISVAFGRSEARQKRIAVEALAGESTAREKAERTAAFMQQILGGVSPWKSAGYDTAILKKLMDDAAGRIERGELKDAPESELALRLTIGDVYRRIAEFDAAERMLGRTEAMARDLADDEGDNEQVAAALNAEAWLLRDRGRPDAALPKYEAALAMRERLHKGDHADVAMTLNSLGACLQSLGRAGDALPRFEAALAMRKRLFPGDHAEVAVSLNSVAANLLTRGRPAEALPLYEESLAMRQRLFTGDHPHVAEGLNNVGFCLETLRRSNEALPKYQAGLDMYKRLFKGDHPTIAVGLNNVAGSLDSLGRTTEALAMYEESLAMRRRLYKGDHADIAKSLNNIAYCLHALGRPADALERLSEAVEIQQRLIKGDHPDVVSGLTNVAGCLKALNRAPEALPKYEAALSMSRRLFKGDHPLVASGLVLFATCLQETGNPAGAVSSFEEALAMYGRLKPENPVEMRRIEAAIGEAQIKLGRFDEAEAKLNGVWAWLEKQDKPFTHMRASTLNAMIRLFEQRHAAEPDRGFDARALEWREKLTQWQSTTQPDKGK